MTADSNEGIAAHSPSVEHSMVYLHYEPSEELHGALQGYLKPQFRQTKRLGRLMLQSERFYRAPLVENGRPLEHPHRINGVLADYNRQLQRISPQTQMPLASVAHMEIAPRGLALRFEILPDSASAERLGSLALRSDGSYPALLYLPKETVNTNFRDAHAHMQQLLAVHHPSRGYNPRGTAAPSAHRLWVQSPVLRDRLLPQSLIASDTSTD